MDCLFCKIAHGEIHVQPVFENKDIIAFNDIAPQAPIHILVIPKLHIESLNNAKPDNTLLLGNLLDAAKRIAEEKGIAQDGYRLVINTQAGAGQTVWHLHIHLLAGRQMTWPPG